MPLTAERLREILHYDPETGIFTWKISLGNKIRKAGDVAGSQCGTGYINISIGGRTYTASRLAWLYTYGRWPAVFLDHKDHDRTNNRLSNLREADFRQNVVNASIRSNNTSGYVGVVARWGKWVAQIKVHGKRRHLGMFSTPQEASAAYNAERIRLHGEFGETAHLQTARQARATADANG